MASQDLNGSPLRIIAAALDEAHDLAGYYLTKANEANSRASRADDQDDADRFRREAQVWFRKYDELEDEADDIDRNRVAIAMRMIRGRRAAVGHGRVARRPRSRERCTAGRRRSRTGTSSSATDPPDPDEPPGESPEPAPGGRSSFSGRPRPPPRSGRPQALPDRPQ